MYTHYISALTKRLFPLAAVSALTMAFALTAVASDKEVRLRAELYPTKAGEKAEGDAEWEKKDDRVRFRVDVKDVEKDGVGTVLVKRDGKVVFYDDIKIDDGEGRLEIDTDDDKGDAPKLKEYDDVIVKDSKGVEVLEGTLEKD